jgi:hypothetical protein
MHRLLCMCLNSLPKMTVDQLSRLIAGKAMPAQILPPEPKTEPGVRKHTGWEYLSSKPHATSFRFHVPPLSRSRRYSRWLRASSSRLHAGRVSLRRGNCCGWPSRHARTGRPTHRHATLETRGLTCSAALASASRAGAAVALCGAKLSITNGTRASQ